MSRRDRAIRRLVRRLLPMKKKMGEYPWFDMVEDSMKRLIARYPGLL